MTLEEVLRSQPPVRRVPDARAQVRDGLVNSGRRLVIIDDDPTGAQTVHDVSELMDWSVATLQRALEASGPVFFVCSNSRSLPAEEMRRVSLEVGHNLRQAARAAGITVVLASRGDSTLRGHYPGEVTALCEGLDLKPDGVIIAPAFLEAGRYTIDDVHWAEQAGQLVPVHQTEFARDPVFGYKNSNLRAWVVEKGGAQRIGDVKALSLKTIREGGVPAVTAELMTVAHDTPVIVNAAAYEDLDVVALGLMAAEQAGKTFVYQCSASFVKARGGFTDKPLLTYQDMAPGNGPGLVIAGSFVDKTSAQLGHLLESGLAEGVELHVGKLAASEREHEIEAAAHAVDERLTARRTVALYTSRQVQTAGRRGFQQTGAAIMDALCHVVGRLKGRPGFVIAKGGITSISVARQSLGAQEAYVLGQIILGVPVWRLGAGARWPDIPYVVFPGNVGDENALVRALGVLKG
jgi:uncharacterized protein YgbK (DUF1537 family)